VSVSCVSTDVLVTAETSPTESLQCLDICLLMSLCLSFGGSQRHVTMQTWAAKSVADDWIMNKELEYIRGPPWLDRFPISFNFAWLEPLDRYTLVRLMSATQ
jgi:hypothetical protein